MLMSISEVLNIVAFLESDETTESGLSGSSRIPSQFSLTNWDQKSSRGSSRFRHTIFAGIGLLQPTSKGTFSVRSPSYSWSWSTSKVLIYFLKLFEGGLLHITVPRLNWVPKSVQQFSTRSKYSENTWLSLFPWLRFTEVQVQMKRETFLESDVFAMTRRGIRNNQVLLHNLFEPDWMYAPKSCFKTIVWHIRWQEKNRCSWIDSIIAHFNTINEKGIKPGLRHGSSLQKGSSMKTWNVYIRKEGYPLMIIPNSYNSVLKDWMHLSPKC